MASYEAGSVTAKIILDTGEWNKAIGKLKEEIKGLQTTFNSIKGSNGLDKQVKALKKELDSLKESNNNYRDTIKNLRKENEELIKNNKKVSDSVKEEEKTLDTYVKKLDEVKKAKEKITRNTSGDKPTLIPVGETEFDIMERKLNRIIAKLKEGQIEEAKFLGTDRTTVNRFGTKDPIDVSGWKKASEVLGEVKNKFNEFAMPSAIGHNIWGQWGNLLNSEVTKQLNHASTEAKQFKTQLSYVARTLKETCSQFNRFEMESQKAIASMTKAAIENEKFGNALNSFNRHLAVVKEFSTVYDSSGRAIARVSEILQSFNFKLLETADTESILYRRTVNLASAMQRLHAQGAKDWQFNEKLGKWEQSSSVINGTGNQFGYSSYVSNISKVRQETEKLKIATGELGAAYQKNGINLNTYKANMAGISKEMDKVTTSAQRVKNAQLQLQYFQRTDYLNQYKANMGEINAKLKEQTTNIRETGKGLTSFNNGITQTAHSGRILSNTLYQIRGALLSLKMIFTAMGGMMLWGFAMDIAESVKETTTAKNEMEAQLNQNSKVDASGIQYFRNELDKLTDTFKKVNKYTVGETVSSIGLEFNMSAKQMADALPIVTMIQSEYVRAGRKTSEAALAVKDILQGEFQRLSRETGVGKEELIAYGWDEDKTNIDGLLQALQKAALDRHWDIFAQKATSLNDVIEITKSRFSELGADITDSLTPMIVGGFNLIIDAISKLSNAFNSMGAFGRNFTFFGGGLAGLTGILTLLPMITKNMGLAEIATVGWGKSILTATLNLNKSEVALYGFRKALAAVITGTQASEIANVRTTKAIMGRILGVKQSTLAEHGYLTALVKSKMELTTYGPVMSDASIAAMNLRQKIIYLAQGELVADKASASWGKTIKSLITSTRLWRLALFGITSIGLVAWLASIAQWCEIVKGKIEVFNNMLQSGQDRYNSAKKTVESYTNQISKLTKGTEEYNRAVQNRKTAILNRNDLYQAKELAKTYDEQNKKLEEANNLKFQEGRNQLYRESGQNIEKEGHWALQTKQAQEYLVKSEEEKAKFQYASLQHMKEHVDLMKEAGLSEEDRVKYITEYSTKAEEAAEHLKKFNQGDFMSGVYYLLDRLQLIWIDLWNDKDFINFWNAVQKTFNDLKPTLEWIKDSFLSLGRTLMQYFSTEEGRWTFAFGAIATGIGLIAYKFRGVIGTLVDVGKSVWSRIKEFKELKKAAEEASDVLGKGEETSTSTGGINGGNAPTSRGEWWQNTKGALYQDATKYARAAAAIAAGMLLVSEAIIMLTVPMWSLAQTGKYFKSVEPSIRAGIEGLKLIAPVMAIFLPPVVALIVIMDKFGSAISWESMGDAFLKSAVGIAMAITLVAEAIFLMAEPIIALGSLGAIYGTFKSNVQQGVEAIKVTDEALRALIPWVPVFVAGIALAAVTIGTEGIGGIAILATVAGIAIGIGLVTEAIYGLSIPLGALGDLGNKFPDLSNVRQGTEAMKVTAEALGYVEDAMASLAKIEWDMLSQHIAEVVGSITGMDLDSNLSQLTADDGIFSKLQKFVDEFDKVTLTVPEGFSDKVTSLAGVSDSISSISDALTTVKTAVENLPKFNTGDWSGTALEDSAYAKMNEGSGDLEGFFEQLRTPIEQLSSFMNDFNNMEIIPPDTTKVETINQSASMIATLQTAIDNVKNAVGAGVDAQWNANMASNGIVGAAIGYLFGDGNPNASSLKSSLDELYNAAKDIMDFNSKIAGLTSEGSGNGQDVVDASNMVSALQTQINNLKTTLSSAVPTVKSAANDMGKAIVDGVKSGVSDLADSVSPNLDKLSTTVSDAGQKASDGFKDKFKVKDIATAEVDAALAALDDGKIQEFYDKGYAMGDAFQRGYKAGGGINSPGYAAQAMEAEIGYIQQYIQDGITNLPLSAWELAQGIANQFSSAFGEGTFTLPELPSFQEGLNTLSTMVDTVKLNVSNGFNTIQTNIGNAFNNIRTKAATSYQNIVSNTQTNMANMQSVTTKNIGAIRTSWHGMQDALIASAENIRSQTSTKINTLKDNMAAFWKKIRNPELLISGSAGPMQTGKGTVKRRYAPRGGGFAGNNIPSRSQSLFPTIRSKGAPDDLLSEYLKCIIETGKPCYAGWDFNWTKDISNRFKKWDTHFNKYHLDDFLNVGKFENSNFPVKGRADVAKQYIFDVISATRYGSYFDSMFGEDPVAALRAGVFNCWDGTNIVLAIARAFGFYGSRGHGTWNGVGHVWASIPGLGIIDPTAIQQRGSFTSSAVSGYAGAIRRTGSSTPSIGETNNYGDIHITINNNGEDVSVNEKNIDRQVGKKIYELISPSLYTGQ